MEKRKRAKKEGKRGLSTPLGYPSSSSKLLLLKLPEEQGADVGCLFCKGWASETWCLGVGPEPTPSCIQLATTLQPDSLPRKPWYECERRSSAGPGVGGGLGRRPPPQASSSTVPDQDLAPQFSSFFGKVCPLQSSISTCPPMKWDFHKIGRLLAGFLSDVYKDYSGGSRHLKPGMGQVGW